MKAYYSDDAVTIYHGDCEEIVPDLPLVDLVFTSPPYNLGASPTGGFGHWRDGQNHGGYGKWSGAGRDGIDYESHDDALLPAIYEAWQGRVLHMLWEQLTDVGAIFYNHRTRVQADTLWTPLVLNPGLPIRQIITWNRGSGMNYALTHFVPASEWVIVFAKPAWRLERKEASGLLDVWNETPDHGNEHPAPFPLGLPARAIQAAPDGLVLDPFMGSGTTLRAAKNAGQEAIGIDKSERYCEIAARRCSQEVLAL